MIECPSCRKRFERQPNFCERCGYRFTVSHDVNGAPATLRSSRVVMFITSGAGTAVALGLLIAAAVIATLFSKHEIRPVKSSSPRFRVVAIGETVEVQGGPWVCGSTRGALDEMAKWVARNDTEEMVRTLLRTHSLLLDAGMKVKKLDDGGFLYQDQKVRVVAGKEGTRDARVGRECWTVAEALNPR